MSSKRNVFHRIYEALKGYYQLDGPMLAASLSYFFLFGIIPLTFIALAAGGFIWGKNPALEQSFIGQVQRILPPLAQEQVLPTLVRFAKNWEILGAIAIAGFFFTAVNLFNVIERGLSVMLEIKQRRRFWKSSAVYVFFTLGVFLFFAAAAILYIGFSSLKLLPFEGIIKPFVGALKEIFSFIIYFVAFLLIYTLLPYKKPRISCTASVAAIISVAWLVAQRIYGVILTLASTRTKIYGALTGSILSLVWIYILMTMLLMGARLIHEFERPPELVSDEDATD
jgi:membrane protein